MTKPDDDRFGDLLKQAVPEPANDPGDRADRARTEARRLRRSRRTAVALAAVAVAGLVAVPTLLRSLDDPGTDVARSPVASGSPHCAGIECDVAALTAAIREPLSLPTVAPGAACPVSDVRRFPAGAGFNSPFDALGPGPLHLAGNRPIDLANGEQDRVGPWRSQKVIWVIDETYSGPLLLRGARIDGAGDLAFLRYLGAAGYTGGAGDGAPHRSLLYPRAGLSGAAPAALESLPSGIFVKGPGCYAVQADGVGFSETLVFEVRAGSRQ